jgi:Phage P22-like portal protein
MSTSSGDNWDLIGDVPGVKRGPATNLSPFEDVDNNEALVSRIRNFYDEGVGAWEENRRMHSEDLNFIYNSEAMGQWDPVVLQNRRGKPCYTFNRCIGPVNIVVSDMRQTKPAGKVRPASDGASEPVAEIYGGLCRSIEQASRAEQIYKEQYKYAVAGGFGAWRIMPVYMADDGEGAFDQVLRVINIANPQTVIWDPQCADPCAGDANRCIVAERIHEDIYHSLYKDGSGQSLNVSRDSYGWFTDNEVRIGEYFERVPTEKWIAKMTDGTVKTYDQELKDVEKGFDEHGITHDQHGVTRIAKDKRGHLMVRKTIVWKVLWVKIDGSNVLEGPYIYDWKRIPVVRCPGRYINIEGRKKFQSLIRHAKDAQRSYNSRSSDMIERSALIPKAPYLVTETMIKGYENEWNQANVQSRPYLPYNIDKIAPEGGMPFRVAPLDLPQGAIALAQMAISDIQATIGYYDPALGNSEAMDRTPAKALVQHTKRSDLGSYEFVDGFGAALQLTWEMFVDMIPHTYDAERTEIIIGHDGMEKLVGLNQVMDDETVMNDLKKGAYDVTVTIGPSYQTARQETLATLIDAAEAMPMVSQFCPDLLVKNIDSPDAQEMARRLRIPLIKQGIIQPTTEEKKAGIVQAPPDPAQQLQLQLLKAKTEDMTGRAAITTSRAQVAPLEQHKLIYEVAGKHLGNLKMAHEMGNDQVAAQAEQQAAAFEQQQTQQQGQQDLQQGQQQHQQQMQQGQQQHAADIDQQTQQHAADLAMQAQAHGHELARTEDAHRRELQRTTEKHQLALKHAGEMHTQKLAQAKALAAVKPKKSAKKAA